MIDLETLFQLLILCFLPSSLDLIKPPTVIRWFLLSRWWRRMRKKETYGQPGQILLLARPASNWKTLFRLQRHLVDWAEVLNCTHALPYHWYHIEAVEGMWKLRNLRGRTPSFMRENMRCIKKKNKKTTDSIYNKQKNRSAWRKSRFITWRSRDLITIPLTPVIWSLTENVGQPWSQKVAMS